MLAIPLVYCGYVGVAESARDRVLQLPGKHPYDEHLCDMVGGLENELMAAKIALKPMIATATVSQPSFETTCEISSFNAIAQP